jgi:hypothetical protein
MEPSVLRLAQVLAVVGMFGGFWTVLGVGVWAVVKRVNRSTSRAELPPADDSRLMRLEQAVDAIAIEVERIGEAQRYTNKLMNERAAERLPAGEKSTGGKGG